MAFFDLVHFLVAELLPANLGYFEDPGAYCATSNDEAPVAVPKGGQCPSTMIPSGAYCVQLRWRP